METSPEDFKIKSLATDKDALILIGISVVLAVLLVMGLALLSEAQWERLVSRSKILYAAGLAVVPAVIAIWQRYKLRRDAVRGLGQASTTVVTPYPASVVRAPKGDA